MLRRPLSRGVAASVLHPSDSKPGRASSRTATFSGMHGASHTARRWRPTLCMSGGRRPQAEAHWQAPLASRPLDALVGRHFTHDAISGDAVLNVTPMNSQEAPIAEMCTPPVPVASSLVRSTLASSVRLLRSRSNSSAAFRNSASISFWVWLIRSWRDAISFSSAWSLDSIVGFAPGPCVPWPRAPNVTTALPPPPALATGLRLNKGNRLTHARSSETNAGCPKRARVSEIPHMTVATPSSWSARPINLIVGSCVPGRSDHASAAPITVTESHMNFRSASHGKIREIRRTVSVTVVSYDAQRALQLPEPAWRSPLVTVSCKCWLCEGPHWRCNSKRRNIRPSLSF